MVVSQKVDQILAVKVLKWKPFENRIRVRLRQRCINDVQDGLKSMVRGIGRNYRWRKEKGGKLIDARTITGL